MKKIVSVMLIAVCSFNAGASASIAKIPQAVSYIYADGTIVKLSCNEELDLEKAPECTFEIQKKQKRKTFKIDTEVADYVINFHLSPWRFKYFEGDFKHFAIELDVQCDEKDFQIVEKKLYPQCSLYFELKNKVLTADQVTISYDDGEKYATESRSIHYE